MLKIGEAYSINNGQGSIVFTEGKQGTINAVYEVNSKKDAGKINGILSDNVLKGTYHNSFNNSSGLIEFTFTEDGFNCKWKQGLEPGPMRGKWLGILSKDLQNNPTEGSINLNLDTSLSELKSYVDELVKKSSQEQASFIKNVLTFINENDEYYWWIPAIKIQLQLWENKIDDENLNLSLESLLINGDELDFNPYDYYRLYYNTRERLFSIDEDDEEPNSFFEAVMFMNDHISPEELVIICNDSDQTRYHKFINKCKTALYCTISKTCEDGIDADDLSELLLGVNFYENLSDIDEEIYGGDIANEIQNDVLLSFGIEREDFDNEEELWRDIFLTDWEAVAQELLDNDVFDNDII